MDAPIHGLSATTRYKGIGKVRWNIRGSMDPPYSIETTAVYISEADIRLFNPQGYFGKYMSDPFLRIQTEQFRLFLFNHHLCLISQI